MVLECIDSFTDFLILHSRRRLHLAVDGIWIEVSTQHKKTIVRYILSKSELPAQYTSEKRNSTKLAFDTKIEDIGLLQYIS